jgi:hypothetical protein
MRAIEVSVLESKPSIGSSTTSHLIPYPPGA